MGRGVIDEASQRHKMASAPAMIMIQRSKNKDGVNEKGSNKRIVERPFETFIIYKLDLNPMVKPAR